MTDVLSGVQPLMIDSPTTVDRDDAIAVEGDGEAWVASVWIADVAAAVPIGSRLDDLARGRGVSVYLADGRRPMLGRVELAATLAEATPRAAVRVDVAVRKGEAPEVLDVTRAPLDRARAITYGRVGHEVAMKPTTPLQRHLRVAYELASYLFRQRRAGGAIAAADCRGSWITNEDGRVVRIAAGDARAHLIVQELMILANTTLAGYVLEHGASMLFRNHVVPDVMPGERERIVGELDVFADIDDAAATPDRGQLLSHLPRAEYGPDARGHFALNLPVYAHMTSPLRRYADLVNQRVLTSLVEGTQMPYGDDELARIAAGLNARILELHPLRQEAMAEVQKEKAFRTVVHAGRAGQQLGDDAVFRGAKAALSVGQWPENLDAEIRRRAAEGTLEPRTAHRVLFERHDVDLGDLPGAVMEYLAANPSVAVSVLTTETQRSGWAPVVFEEEREGPVHAMWFTTVAVLDRDGETVRSAARRHPTRKAAQQQAVLSLLAAVLGADDPSCDHAESGGGVTAEAPPAVSLSGNAVSALFEYASKAKVAAPRFSLGRMGSDHEPIHTAEITVTLANGEKFVATGEGGSRKVAKERAAENARREILDA